MLLANDRGSPGMSVWPLDGQRDDLSDSPHRAVAWQ
jgi:hypothetical protein